MATALLVSELIRGLQALPITKQNQPVFVQITAAGDPLIVTGLVVEPHGYPTLTVSDPYSQPDLLKEALEAREK